MEALSLSESVPTTWKGSCRAMASRSLTTRDCSQASRGTASVQTVRMSVATRNLSHHGRPSLAPAARRGPYGLQQPAQRCCTGREQTALHLRVHSNRVHFNLVHSNLPLTLRPVRESPRFRGWNPGVRRSLPESSETLQKCYQPSSVKNKCEKPRKTVARGHCGHAGSWAEVAIALARISRCHSFSV